MSASRTNPLPLPEQGYTEVYDRLASVRGVRLDDSLAAKQRHEPSLEAQKQRNVEPYLRVVNLEHRLDSIQHPLYSRMQLEGVRLGDSLVDPRLIDNRTWEGLIRR